MFFIVNTNKAVPTSLMRLRNTHAGIEEECRPFVLSVLLRYTVSDYPCSIFKLFRSSNWNMSVNLLHLDASV
jgi:hypothetical protein